LKSVFEWLRMKEAKDKREKGKLNAERESPLIPNFMK
jgi:hypothetical protein